MKSIKLHRKNKIKNTIKNTRNIRNTRKHKNLKGGGLESYLPLCELVFPDENLNQLRAVPSQDLIDYWNENIQDIKKGKKPMNKRRNVLFLKLTEFLNTYDDDIQKLKEEQKKAENAKIKTIFFKSKYQQLLDKIKNTLKALEKDKIHDETIINRKKKIEQQKIEQKNRTHPIQLPHNYTNINNKGLVALLSSYINQSNNKTTNFYIECTFPNSWEMVEDTTQISRDFLPDEIKTKAEESSFHITQKKDEQTTLTYYYNDYEMFRVIKVNKRTLKPTVKPENTKTDEAYHLEPQFTFELPSDIEKNILKSGINDISSSSNA